MTQCHRHPDDSSGSAARAAPPGTRHSRRQLPEPRVIEVTSLALATSRGQLTLTVWVTDKLRVFPQLLLPNSKLLSKKQEVFTEETRPRFATLII